MSCLLTARAVAHFADLQHSQGEAGGDPLAGQLRKDIVAG
jgi:hypothetical protein